MSCYDIHPSMPLVSGLLTDRRSHAQVSSLYWSLNTDLHQEKVTNALEYISTMKANLEPLCPSSDGQKNALESLFSVHQDFGKGRFHVRFKLRKGRVRVMSEEYHVDQSGINFSPISSEETVIPTTKSLLPKVQFNLQLPEKEQVEKEKVVLPFEHQDNGNHKRSMMGGDLSLIQESCRPMWFHHVKVVRLYISEIQTMKIQILMMI